MKWKSALGGISAISALVFSFSVDAASQTYIYSVTHPRYGVIGSYVHTIDDGDGVANAQSILKIAVKVLGFVVYRQSADQTEVWRGQRLMSFQSVTVTNGRQLTVSGVASENHFLVTSPSGTAQAPGDVVASDPWSLNRIGRGVVVSTRTGKIDAIEVTGGEADTIMQHGKSAVARHFHVNTAAQPNKWEVWLDPQGVPIKFRSLEGNGAIDFTLVSAEPQPGGAAKPSGPGGGQR